MFDPQKMLLEFTGWLKDQDYLSMSGDETPAYNLVEDFMRTVELGDYTSADFSTPMVGQLAPMAMSVPLARPKRTFKVLYGRKRLGPEGTVKTEDVVETENIDFRESFVIFSEGEEFAVKSNVRAIAWEPGMSVEEIYPEMP